MRKHFALFSLLVAGTLPTLAQTTPATSLQVPSEPAAKAPYQFCTMEATQRWPSKPSFSLDYGPKNTTKRTETQTYDERWKVEALSSFAEALNFMTAKGWDFVSSNAVLSESGLTRYQYIFRRPSGQ